MGRCGDEEIKFAPTLCVALKTRTYDGGRKTTMPFPGRKEQRERHVA